jgi:hypothetical protein
MGPKREDRLNPMSRRKGRPPGPPPSAEWMVLKAEITCNTCGWVGLEMDAGNAIDTFNLHHGLKHEDIPITNYTLKEEQ